MSKFWLDPMPEEQFQRMKRIIDAPSPVGLEAAMTYGVLKPYYEEVALKGWKVHQFKGSAAVVLDTHPGRDDLLSVMVIGHADKIRMQVRSIGSDGKIWLNCDSFLPYALMGHEVVLYSKHPDNHTQYRAIHGGTLEALPAIHLAPPDYRSGSAGIKSDMIYLELQLTGEKRRQQVLDLGIQAGDPLLFRRPLRRGASPNTFYGAYLDNGLGCFVTTELATLVAKNGGLQNVRLLLAAATHEEIGRFGSRVLANHFKPDVVIGVDVSHDFNSAPMTRDKRLPDVSMGAGFTLSHGAVGSYVLNSYIISAAKRADIPFQTVLAGRDFGTDAMAAAFAAHDAAATSVGFPIRNMHTISESGHTHDVLSAIAALFETFKDFDTMGITPDDFKNSHPRLDQVEVLTQLPVSH